MGQYLLMSAPAVALISVLMEQLVNVNGFITALAPVREKTGLHVLQIDGEA